MSTLQRVPRPLHVLRQFQHVPRGAKESATGGTEQVSGFVKYDPTGGGSYYVKRSFQEIDSGYVIEQWAVPSSRVPEHHGCAEAGYFRRLRAAHLSRDDTSSWRPGPVRLRSRWLSRPNNGSSGYGSTPEKRATPPSVRFFGRKVHLAAVVVLVVDMRQGPSPRRGPRTFGTLRRRPQEHRSLAGLLARALSADAVLQGRTRR